MITGKGNIGELKGTTSLKTCKPGTVVNSDGTFTENVASGGTLTLPEIDITNSSGTVITTIPSAKPYEVIDATVTNSEGTLIKSVPAAAENDVLNDINVTKTNGSIITWPAGKDYACDVVPRSYNWPQRTGQTTSFRVGDDAWVQANFFNNLTVGKTPKLENFFNLKNEAGNENIFGHFKRLTGLTGGYRDEVTNQWKDVNGNVTTEALAKPSGYLICHFTGLGWLDPATAATYLPGQRNWDSMIDGARGITHLGHNNYFLANKSQLQSICNFGNFLSGTLRAISYLPFVSAANAQYPTSTSDNAGLTVQFLDGGRFFTTQAKSFAGWTVPPICRKHF